MDIITYTFARSNLAKTMKKVCDLLLLSPRKSSK